MSNLQKSFANIVKSNASAKLILSGEHSLLYGQPALAMTIDRLITTSVISKNLSTDLCFNFSNLCYVTCSTLNELRALKRRIQERFRAFIKGSCQIQDVILEPCELLLYAFTHFVEKCGFRIVQGFSVAVDSMIPIGCGMGSSAAAIISLLRTMTDFFGLKISGKDYIDLGREIENLQHARSSGLDLYLALHGGSILWQNGVIKNRILPSFPMRLINSGKPETYTGECVASAAQYIQNNGMLKNFATVTLLMDKAFDEHNLVVVQECIRENHQLLKAIGEVPQKVQEFISTIEKRGLAAKICGAGASRGQKGGVVLVVGEEDISNIVNDYGFMQINE